MIVGIGVLPYLYFFCKSKLRGIIMKIEFLKLLNFRNYSKLNLSFHPSLNIIYGKNGSGKTNLVEGIYVLAVTRSFRLASEKTLISLHASLCKVEGNVYNRFKTNYQVFLSKDGKKVKINNNKVSRVSDYISKITVVLFHPDDLRFIKDTPSTRRKNLNISISLVTVEYLRYLNNYNKILKQRNAYLKQMFQHHNENSSYLNILTEKLVDYGIYLYQKRLEFVSAINEYIDIIYKKIAGVGKLEIRYLSDYDCKNKEEILAMYQKNLEKDIMFGKTNVGIHTDDLKFLLDGKDLKEYGSEGQQKNAIISYKFSELEIFKEKTGTYPILILDDLFSELDQEKIENILSLLKCDYQTFITTTSLDHFKSLKEFSYKTIHIEQGSVVEESEHE